MNLTALQTTIQGIKTAVPVSIELESKPSNMRKTDNPYADAVKVVTINGMIGMNYSNAVNNQLGREDKKMSFEVSKPVWMERHGKNLGTNKKGDRLYLPIKVQSSSKPVYKCDGVDVTDKVQSFLRKPSTPKTQVNLEKKVIWRTPALDSIKKIRMLGAEYTIEG